jgi:ABC-type dipeptide/oligopeptide/nickel transport system ATPase subunit
MTSPEAGEAVIAARELTKVYRSGHRQVRALDGVSFEVLAGQTLAVIGESGSGKSTLTRLITGLETPTSGSISINGKPARLRPGHRGDVQLVFQDPAGSLNPHRKIWKSAAEPLRHLGRAARRAAVAEMLNRVGIDPHRLGDRPGRFSGGQLQRIAIARVLVARAQVLLCDEPTSALDVSVQAQILNLLRELQLEIGFTCVFVTHDLAVAQVVADHVLVLRAGQVREHASAAEFFAGPRDPYSRSLVAVASGSVARRAARPTAPN